MLITQNNIQKYRNPRNLVRNTIRTLNNNIVKNLIFEDVILTVMCFPETKLKLLCTVKEWKHFTQI